MIPLVKYKRVSTDMQEESGLGLDAQDRALEAYRQKVDGYWIAELEEIESAANHDTIKFNQQVNLDTLLRRRPIFKNAILIAQKNNAKIVVSTYTRLTRFGLLAEYLFNSGVKFVCADAENDDEFVTMMKIKLGEGEAKNTSKNTQKGLYEKRIRDGEWRHKGHKHENQTAFMNGEVAALGRKARKEMSLLNENNIRAKAMIGEMQKQNLSFGQMAIKLNSNNFKTALGYEFRKSTVYRLSKTI